MVERAPQARHDEQYPLLKVAGGAGDGGGHHQPSQAVPGPGWGVTCTPKKSWSFRWPENLSITQILIWLGILFLIFCPWDEKISRRQSPLISECPAANPACDVYYHNIVQRGSHCPLVLYVDYLSSVATQYPSLCFHVFFLVDDSLKTLKRSRRDTIIFDSDDRFPLTSSYGKFGFQDIQHFKTKYKNVNVTVMALSEFMNMIPLEYNWRNIPPSYLTFYTRIFSVWLNGGIAMDLDHFNDNYNLKQTDRTISNILKQHNDGIKAEEYANLLNKVNLEEEYEFFTMLNRLIQQMFNNTRTFLSKNIPFPQITTENGVSQNKSLLRINRNKRDGSTPINDKNYKSENASNVHLETINMTKEEDLKKNEYQLLSNPNTNSDKLKLTVNNAVKALQMANSNIVNGNNETVGLNNSETLPKMKNNTSRVVLFYDFLVLSNGMAPKPPQIGKDGKLKNDKPVLSIESEGMFVAASTSLHPFLTHLISMRCPHIRPKCAIENILFSHCSGLFDEDNYCNNIYIL